MDASSMGTAAGDERWNRLQTYLFALRPGAVVTVRGMAKRTGLDTDAIEMVLRALMRASLFRQRGRAHYVRQRIHPDNA
jgi:hypothetical protein